jgi:hypothetical protein
MCVALRFAHNFSKTAEIGIAGDYRFRLGIATGKRRLTMRRAAKKTVDKSRTADDLSELVAAIDNRSQFVETTLKLATVLRAGRLTHPSSRAFSAWLKANNLHSIHPHARRALIAFAGDIERARRLLEKSKSRSVREIFVNRWERRRGKYAGLPAS